MRRKPHEISGRGEKFERKKFELPKNSNFFPLQLFSSKSFLVHMEAKWNVTVLKTEFYVKINQST